MHERAPFELGLCKLAIATGGNLSGFTVIKSGRTKYSLLWLIPTSCYFITILFQVLHF